MTEQEVWDEMIFRSVRPDSKDWTWDSSGVLQGWKAPLTLADRERAKRFADLKHGDPKRKR